MAADRYVQRVRFHVLGTLGVTVDGNDLPLGGPQQRLVLALLISAEGQAVSTSQLISGVWGEEPPPTARKALQGNIHRLRSALGDVIVTESNGYSLDTDGNVDALEFVRLHDEGESQVQSAPERAAEVLREALGLWNGPAYADLSDELALAPEIARLENLRLATVGDRVDADLALGRHETLIGELEGLTLEHPFQERFWAQHMTALYRAGRQTEALRSFERLRRFLADESGLEPSEEVKSLEEKILNQDPSLAVDAEAEPGSDPAAIRGYELREKVASDEVSETYRAYQRSVGRQVSVRVIGPRVANDPVFISNFLADTQRVAAVDHPHISYVYDTWREPGKAYQVSRWLGGGSLDDSPPRGLRSSLSILTNIGDALANAHRLGVAHGSVDASHVLFDESGHPYLTGFVVGRQQSEDDLARDRLDFAVLAQEVIGGRPPREVDGRLHPDLGDSSMETVFEVAFSDEGYRRIEDFLRALRRAAGVDVVASRPESPPRTDVRNPYKGLKAFQEADADDFYGRDQLVDRLAETLGRRRLVAVVGPSGSGKSSVVKAGLLPRLRSNSELRLITEMYPGAFPFEELEGALLRVGVDRTSLIEDLISDDRGLLRVLKQIIPSDDTELVLIIDQFEELFSTVDDEQTRKLFLDNLVNSVSEPRSHLRVVITMRADFFDRPLEHPRFGDLLQAGLIPITLPDDDQLAQATVMPARSEGVEFEDGLVSQIVSDVSGQPGGLPLLQYALTELFDSRDSDILTLSAFQRSGGVHGALGRRAEEIYEDLTPAEQSSVREAFLRMVSVDESADDLRRRVRRSELSGVSRQKDLDNALQAYAAARLITFDRDPVTRGPTVEVAHEALLREWSRLRNWIEEQRDDLVIRRRLDTALEEWQQSGEDEGYLPTGSRLAQFEEWAAETELTLSGPERAFLQAGVEKEAELQARASRRRRRIMTGFGIAAIVATALAAFGWVQKQNADENAAAAQANAAQAEANAAAAETERITADAVLLAEPNRRLGLLLAAEAYQRDPGPATLGALQRVMVRNPGFLGYFGTGNSYIDVRWPVENLVVALARDHLDVYDLESRARVNSIPVQVGPYLEERRRHPGFEISKGGEMAVVEGSDNTIVVIDLSSGATIEIPHDREITSVALSSDGSRVAFGDSDGHLTVLAAGSGERLWSIDAHPEGSYAEIEKLAEAGLPEAVEASPTLAAEEAVAFSGVTALEFDPGADRIASSGGVFVRLWDTETGEADGEELKLYPPEPDLQAFPEGFPWITPLELIFAHEAVVASGSFTTARFVPEEGPWPLLRLVPIGESASRTNYAGLEARSGSDFVYGLTDGRIVHYDYDAGTVLGEIDTQLNLRNIAHDPVGDRVIAAADNGLVMASLDNDQLLAEALPSGGNRTLTVYGDLVTASEIFDLSSEPMIWDLSGAEPRRVHLRDGGNWFTEATIHPDGDLIAQFETPLEADRGQDTRTAVFYDAETGEPTGFTVPPEGLTAPMAWGMWIFSPDGRQVASKDWDIGLQIDSYSIFDVETEELVTRLEFAKGEDAYLSSSILGWGMWSPDGSRFILPVDDTARVFETEGWTELEDLAIEGVRRVHYSSNGELLGVIEDDGRITIRDAATHEVASTIAGDETLGTREDLPIDPLFSSDGSRLIVLHNTTMYDIATGTPIGEPFPNEVTPAGWDGQLVTAVDDDILIWNLDTSTWFDIACGAAGRNMTREEWDQFGPNDTDYRTTCPQYGLDPLS